MVMLSKHAYVLRMATGLGYYMSHVHDAVDVTTDVQRAKRFPDEWAARAELACFHPVGLPGWDVVEVLLHDGGVRSIGPAVQLGETLCRTNSRTT